jgi:hypothetical protein
MGTEKAFSAILRQQLAGEKPADAKAGLDWAGGTPNHFALGKAVGYGSSAALGRPALLQFFDDQWQHGHMARGDANEVFTDSHFSWWQNAMAGAWLLARRRGDDAVLARVRRWWRAELAAENLCASPTGRVEMPCGRSHVAGGGVVMSDQRKQREIGRQMILGKKVRLPKTIDAALDMTGLWALDLLRREFPDEFDAVRDADIGDLPVLRDKMVVIRTAGEVTAFFEVFTGMRPCWWAWQRFADSKVAYGIDPASPKNAPGGPRPVSLPEPPAVVGEAPRRVELKAAER